MKLFYQAWTTNQPYGWALAAGLFVAALLAIAAFRSVARRVLPALAAKAGTGFDEVVVHIVDGTKLWLLFPAAVYAAIAVLNLPPTLEHLIDTVAMIVLVAQAAVWLNRFASASTRRYIGLRTTSGEAVTALSMMSFVARLIVWVLAVLLILDQLKFDIRTLVAGLGIGGIAVALAMQNILGDLLASLSIMLDKPFVVGDFIIVGEDLGTVEHIGIKTTRVRALSGQLIVFSNNDLLKSRIHNYKRMYERRVVFTVGVVYETSPETLERIPGILRRAIEMQQKTRFDRANLKECAAYSYNFEAVYFVLDPDYNLYMKIHEAVNLEIIRTFEREHIEFAYPTQTLLVAHPNEARQEEERGRSANLPVGLG